MRELITLHVNGEFHELAVLPHHTLLEVLREDLGLIGTKHGCELENVAPVLFSSMAYLFFLVLLCLSKFRTARLLLSRDWK